MATRLTRRDLMLSIPALAAARRLAAQPKPTIPVRALNHMTLAVSDVKHSVDFYQGLFGMPIQARQGTTTLLRIGAGPQFLGLSPADGATPSITHFCMTVNGFNVDRIVQALAAHGISKADARGGGLSGGPLKVRVRMRGPEQGGAREGTPELYLGDPDGIVVQLQDASYCGGGGALGNLCRAVEAAPGKGLLAVRDLSHFTMFVSASQRSNAFYEEVFGLSVRAYQGPTAPTLAVGPGVQFIMFAGGGRGRGAAPPRPASINHACLSMASFEPDRVIKRLESYGIKPREQPRGPVGPLRHYISLRMENRGGAKEGTPELYFTDPDGLLIQLQDVTYCGGGGRLGDKCSA